MKIERLLYVAIIALPSALAAQADRTPIGFVTGPYSFELSDGEPISWFLEFSEQLKLTMDQKTTLIAIRRRLRGENERFMERLDSVAAVVGLTLGERTRMTPDERMAVERFNKLTQPTRDSIKVNNDLARAEALTLLTNLQQARLDSLVSVLRRERGGRTVRRGGGGVGGS
ncbi:MAG TPA: hypothetical protein VJ717_12345 [Gemmatimonadaceae bacterium]|nr:hypothetical protein [Gemmatimonadaceae bacterium]